MVAGRRWHGGAVIRSRQGVPAEWAAFHAFRRARAEEDDPGEPVLSDAEFEHDTRRQWPSWENRRVLAVAAGEVTGSVGLGFRRQGTEDCGSSSRGSP